ncbi:hypothetical protein F511_14251 [Dorcoceras hygrometricum]|uniref:Uncharacterized protein n=1 Tax=Dorcoceras hygrometricum TaxID=472368 RepID=A0A2Z7BNN8_9LAMI|nr:hypothetical protein F511_14251 [Dorcoceras hygrometricum]
MDSVNALIYYGGYVVIADGRVGYNIPATRPMRISRSITFSQLIHDVHRIDRPISVETLSVDDDVAHGDDPQSFILIVMQGFRTMVVDDEAGPSKYHGDRHGSPTLSGSNMEHAWGSNTTRLDDVISGDWDHYITSAIEEDVVWGSNVATGIVFQGYHGENTTYATNVQDPDDSFGDSARNVTSSEHSIE